jgi:glucose-1-phosphate cytidylyltransferase
MKVVLFCGGLGTRLREFSETIPKPLVEVGYRPIMWHLMRYYAHYGYNEFLLCLGYGGDRIKNYFLHYSETLSNDFTLCKGGREIRLHNSDIDEWTISFIDTGHTSNIGQRLKAVQPHLEGEEVFMANYSDGLSDLHLPDYLDHFYRHQTIASFLCVQPSQSFHVVSMGDDDTVRAITPAHEAGVWINGGFFILRNEIFDYIREGEELVEEPFARLVDKRRLAAYRYRGFWACMDTLKDKTMFDELYARGNMPWAVWRNGKDPRASRALTPAPISDNGPKPHAGLEHNLFSNEGFPPSSPRAEPAVTTPPERSC